MITCPECGQQAADDAKFCDRCGQGLTLAVRGRRQTITPLEPGTTLRAWLSSSLTLMRQNSHENRYRAERDRRRRAILQLREQAGLARPSAPDDSLAKTATNHLKCPDQTRCGGDKEDAERPLRETDRDRKVTRACAPLQCRSGSTRRSASGAVAQTERGAEPGDATAPDDALV